MLKKFPAKTKYFFNFVLPFALLFQWTLPTIEKKLNLQTNVSELILDRCNVPEHSHPPLSQRETSNDPEKFVESYLKYLFLINKEYKIFKISDENNLNKSEPLPICSLAHSPPNRGPPFFEV